MIGHSKSHVGVPQGYGRSATRRTIEYRIDDAYGHMILGLDYLRRSGIGLAMIAFVALLVVGVVNSVFF